MIYFDSILYRMPNNIWFRIAWRSLVNDNSGNGQYCMDIYEARKYVDILNEKYKGEAHHWCECESE